MALEYFVSQVVPQGEGNLLARLVDERYVALRLAAFAVLQLDLRLGAHLVYIQKYCMC